MKLKDIVNRSNAAIINVDEKSKEDKIYNISIDYVNIKVDCKFKLVLNSIKSSRRDDLIDLKIPQDVSVYMESILLELMRYTVDTVIFCNRDSYERFKHMIRFMGNMEYKRKIEGIIKDNIIFYKKVSTSYKSNIIKYIEDYLNDYGYNASNKLVKDYRKCIADMRKYSDEIDSLEGYLEMVRDDELEKRKVENEIKLYTDKLVDTYKLYYRIYDVING